MKSLLLSELTYKIIGLCMEVHRVLGHGFSEVVYKDAMEIEATSMGVLYEREKKHEVHYKGSPLFHKFFSDFEFEQQLIVEVKAAEGAITDDFIAKTLNYMKVSGCKVGLIVNFGRSSLEYKRLVF
jgi:GxxExxY protein